VFANNELVFVISVVHLNKVIGASIVFQSTAQYDCCIKYVSLALSEARPVF